MNSFSAIILGYYIKVKRVLTSLKAIFEKSLLNKIYSSYTHLVGSIVWHFSFKALLHDEQLRRRIFKNELIALNAEWKPRLLLFMGSLVCAAPVGINGLIYNFFKKFCLYLQSRILYFMSKKLLFIHTLFKKQVWIFCNFYHIDYCKWRDFFPWMKSSFLNKFWIIGTIYTFQTFIQSE